MENKEIFAKNLKRYMNENGKSRRDVCQALGFSYYTFSDWVNGKKYPRMDKVEMLANYFGILKSDLIEERTPEREAMQKKSSTIADAALRMKTDSEFMSLVEMLLPLEAKKLEDVKQMLLIFLK